MTLHDLISASGYNCFILCDTRLFEDMGGFEVEYSEEIEAEYGWTPVARLPEPVVSSDGIKCEWGSEWIDIGIGGEEQKVRVLFPVF